MWKGQKWYRDRRKVAKRKKKKWKRGRRKGGKEAEEKVGDRRKGG